MRAFLLVVAVAVFGRDGFAQSHPRQGSPCRGVFQAMVSSGRLNPRASACDSVMHLQIAHYLRQEARRPQDAGVLGRVVELAVPYRDSEVFGAALELARDASAPADAQLLAWFVLTAQHSPTLHLRGIGARPTEWFGRTPGVCDWSEPTDGQYAVERPLPSDYLTRWLNLAHQVSADASRPQRVRAYARCVNDLARSLLPPPVAPVASIQLTPVCGTVFEVRNESAIEVVVRWNLSDSTESGELTLAPHSTARFDSFDPGRVQLLRLPDETVIASATTSTTPCPPGGG